jgi:GNAT superfamily N-acetyltransferase
VKLSFSTAPAETAFPLVRELRIRSFPELAGTEAESEEFFRWKFGTRPSYLFLAQSESAVVGFYAAIPLRYQVAGREARVALVVDVMTDPEIRRQGVFTQLGRFALGELKRAGCDFTTGYPIRPEVVPGHLRVGWKVQIELPLYVAPVRLGGLIRRGPQRLRTVAESAAALTARALTRQATVGAEHDHPALALFSSEELLAHPDYPAFLRRWRTGRLFAIDEPPEFYRWRYGAPGRQFRHLVAHRNGRLTLVLSTRVAVLQGIRTLAVADVLAVPAARAVLPDAWRALWRLAWREELAALAAMAPRELAVATRFRSLPLLPSGRKFRLITCDLASEAPSVAGDPLLKLTWTDTDDV